MSLYSHVSSCSAPDLQIHTCLHTNIVSPAPDPFFHSLDIAFDGELSDRRWPHHTRSLWSCHLGVTCTLGSSSTLRFPDSQWWMLAKTQQEHWGLGLIQYVNNYCFNRTEIGKKWKKPPNTIFLSLSFFFASTSLLPWWHVDLQVSATLISNGWDLEIFASFGFEDHRRLWQVQEDRVAVMNLPLAILPLNSATFKDNSSTCICRWIPYP